MSSHIPVYSVFDYCINKTYNGSLYSLQKYSLYASSPPFYFKFKTAKE